MTRALIVEDSPTQALELQAILEESGFSAEVVSRLDQAVSGLSNGGPDVVLLDLGLPDAEGLEAVRKLRAVAPEVPIVVLTGHEDAETAVQAVHEGAQDYLFKGAAQPEMLSRSIRYAIERERSETLLRRSRDDLLSILNGLRMGTILADAEGRITFASRACGAYLQPRDQALGRPLSEALPVRSEDAEALRGILTQPAAERTNLTAVLEPPGGRRLSVEIEVLDDPGDPDRRIVCLYDVTEVHDLRRLVEGTVRFEDLVGRSPAMARTYELIRQVASVDTTVLIEGETGTGKELVARAIHSLSPRSANPFVAVNCAGLTESLLASQLFGHKRGAFTGAQQDHKGFFETAEGGTLLLDEIGDVSTAVQTNLLRVLQDRQILRVGDSLPRPVDTRVLVATNRNLATAVEEGSFRADLYYRICAARIFIPPLRERREDIPLLVGSFLSELRATTRRPVEAVSEEAMGVLMSHPWPGNVRQLRGAVEFGIIRCPGEVVDVEHLPPEIVAPPQAARSAAAASPPVSQRSGITARRSSPPVRPEEADAERSRIRAALEEAGGNRTQAARLLGIGRATLYRRMEALGLDDGQG